MSAAFTRERLDDLGFTGFLSVRSLVATRCLEVPAGEGVYVVVRPTLSRPTFLTRSVGGWFKGKDPTVDVAVLRRRWLADTPVLYFGKAGTSLRRRVSALIAYGSGKPVSHQGGRYLWQVSGSPAFMIGWNACSTSRVRESILLAEFEKAHGQLPFANLSH